MILLTPVILFTFVLSGCSLIKVISDYDPAIIPFKGGKYV